MIYRLYKPGLPLSQFIDFFFYYDGHHAGHTMEKLLPDGSVDLLIDLTESPKKLFHDDEGSSFNTLKKSWISGMKTNYILIDAARSSIDLLNSEQAHGSPFCSFLSAKNSFQE